MFERPLLPRFEYAAPTQLAELCHLLAQAGSEAALLAGGTDLLVQMRRGARQPRLLLALGRLPGLARLEPAGDGLQLGPLCTMSTLATSPLLADPAWIALQEGARAVGSPLIRNRATIGGNIASARPCADAVPALLALDARVELVRAGGGSRHLALEQLSTGPAQTVLAPEEVLTAIELPAREGPTGSCYLKLARRAALDVTLVGCAASLTFEPHAAAARHVRAARLVLSAVAPLVLRVPEAEQLLVGRAADEVTFAAAAAQAMRVARPIDDHRASATYRREMVGVLVRRALRLAAERGAG